MSYVLVASGKVPPGRPGASAYELNGYPSGSEIHMHLGWTVRVGDRWIGVLRDIAGDQPEILWPGDPLEWIPDEVWDTIEQDPDLFAALDAQENADFYAKLTAAFPGAPRGLGLYRDLNVVRYKGMTSLVVRRSRKRDLLVWRPGWPSAWIRVPDCGPTVIAEYYTLKGSRLDPAPIRAVVFAADPDTLAALLALTA